MDNPFIPAEWGKEYNLAGAVWLCEPDDGMLVIPTYSSVSEFTKDIPTIGNHESDWPTIRNHHALLPSPDWINLRRLPQVYPSRPVTPCLVAIAALERAGANDIVTSGVWRLKFSASIGLEMYPTVGGDFRITFETNDLDNPTLAQYAVDCFKVLHDWAGKVNWK